jgi:hypothetical protein
VKTIKFRDIATIPAADLRPGMILAEGVVVQVRNDYSHLPRQVSATPTVYWVDFAGGQTAYLTPEKCAQVLGKVDDTLLDSIKETQAARA